MMLGCLPNVRLCKIAAGQQLDRNSFPDVSKSLAPNPTMIFHDEDGKMANIVPSARDWDLANTKCIFVHPHAMFPGLQPYKCPDCGHHLQQDGVCEGVHNVVDYTSSPLTLS